MEERLIRLFGIENLSLLKTKNILLVGIGGVGSFCFETLIRCGINNITVIDFDTYEESNLNRQLYALHSTIGKKKIDTALERAKDINPNCNIIVYDEFLDINSNLDFSKYDYIIDACDSVPAKVNIILKAKEYGIKVISSLGIGNRVRPEMVKISTLKESLSDPLGKKLNHYLVKKYNFLDDVVVVKSSEKPIKSEPVSSYVCVTSIAGILLADYVIKDIIK